MTITMFNILFLVNTSYGEMATTTKEKIDQDLYHRYIPISNDVKLLDIPLEVKNKVFILPDETKGSPAVTAKQAKSGAEAAGENNDTVYTSPVSSSSGSSYFRIKDVHAIITRKALSSKLKKRCLELVIRSNKSQDKGKAEKMPRFHFDDNLICEGAAQVDKWIYQVKENKKNKKKQMKLIGKILHAIQDFYSHSNYLEKEIEENKNLKIELSTLNLEKSNCKKILNRYFTSNNHGESLTSYFTKYLIPPSHLHDAKSHLYINKDFHPDYDDWIASKYSRSSFKKIGGRRYFDLIFKLQVKHSKDIFEELKDFIDFKKTCR